ncbi:hypothetical protein TNCV_618071 [Trichonephila clavipes]|nr:hypothetical protein TNCV_618071 [Trichonephila clavipes]
MKCDCRASSDHAPASSTTSRITMSDSSDQMVFSPTNFEQSCRLRETKRYTVKGISALHMSIHGMDGRSPSPRNSFKDLYLSTQAMIRRKEEMIPVVKIIRQSSVGLHLVVFMITETTHQRAPRPSYNHEQYQRYQRFHGFHRRDNQKSQPVKNSGDTVHSISALHSSMLEGARTPTPKNSFPRTLPDVYLRHGQEKR